MLRSAAIAGPAIEAKAINTKTDNATNFFMMVVPFSYLAPRHAVRLPIRRMCWGSQAIDIFDISSRGSGV